MDISARLQQEEHLRRSQKMHALGKLTGGIAHDYNNMLGVIIGYSEILELELSQQPKLAEYANRILHAGERGAKLTKTLLSFSRRKSIDAKRLDINTLLREEHDMIDKALTARINLKFDLSDDLWSAYLDSSDLEDAILNISINAMHAIQDSGQITFETSNESLDETNASILHIDPGEYVLLSITDTGTGMDSSTQEMIFEPFFSTKGDKGTGLGLSQVYGFVERSGGAVKVYSEPGHGTHFALYFPRHHESEYDDKTVESNSEYFTGNETILVVDDEPALLDLTCGILSERGYNIQKAENGMQALEKLELSLIDLLLTDVIMPDIDGYQLAAIVRQKYPSIKIQLTSGFNYSRHVEMVDETLQKNLLKKPFNAQKLLRTIKGLLDQ